MSITTVLIIDHPGSVSPEGAVKQRNDVLTAVKAQGLEVVGASTGYLDARDLSVQLIKLLEGPDDNA